MAMMPEAPVFSVVIPTRNGEPYLRQTISSVLEQTYPHFRLFILESGSTDQTLEIAREYQQRDARFRVITSDEPLDIQGNWARILELELDKYMTILGHDDVLYPQFLETIAGLIAAEPQATLYHTHFHILNADGAISRACKPIPYRQEADAFLSQVHASEQNVSATGYVLRTSDYRRLGGFPMLPRLLFADFLFWYRVTALGYKVCSPEFACGFRIHPASTTQSTQLLNAYDAAVAYYRALEETDFHEEAAKRLGTLAYLTAYFLNRHRTVLLDLMASPAADRLDHYRKVQQTLLRHASQDRLIRVTSPSLVWLARLARLPWTALRRWLAAGITRVIVTRRKMAG
jgi:glycosyltransferase involved in cell wall biosynthesis